MLPRTKDLFVRKSHECRWSNLQRFCRSWSVHPKCPSLHRKWIGALYPTKLPPANQFPELYQRHTSVFPKLAMALKVKSHSCWRMRWRAWVDRRYWILCRGSWRPVAEMLLTMKCRGRAKPKVWQRLLLNTSNFFKEVSQVKPTSWCLTNYYDQNFQIFSIFQKDCLQVGRLVFFLSKNLRTDSRCHPFARRRVSASKLGSLWKTMASSWWQGCQNTIETWRVGKFPPKWNAGCFCVFF